MSEILIVEDDPNLGEILHEYLQLKGFSTTLCRDGLQGQQTFRARKFDLVLLDIMMPKMDGITLAKSIRESDNTPIIFLTARNQREDIITGLKTGADDYVVKPFSMEELLLRIQAILRRSNGKSISEKEQVEFGNMRYDPLTRNLREIHASSGTTLTAREGQLLHILASNLNQTTSRKKALIEIWGDDSYFNARSMDVYINKLRKHLKSDESLQIITVHGEGFKLVKLS